MRITHFHNKAEQTVHYSCAETGKTVKVSMSTLRDLKSTEQLHKLLTDRGLFDKPKYPKHPQCDSKYDRYVNGVFYRCTKTSKSVFMDLDKVKDLTEEQLHEVLTEQGLFKHIVELPENTIETLETGSKLLDLMGKLKDATSH